MSMVALISAGSRRVRAGGRVLRRDGWDEHVVPILVGGRQEIFVEQRQLFICRHDAIAEKFHVAGDQVVVPERAQRQPPAEIQ